MSTTSILINNYNNGAFLRVCVESALAQTQPADEVIVYDDGSTDDSVAILRSFGDRIAVIEGVHASIPAPQAQANAVFRAFQRSTSDLVFLLDGDDCFHPEKLAVYCATFAQNPNLVLVQAPLREIDAGGNPIGDNHQTIKHQPDYCEATYRLHDTDFYYPTSSLAFTREFLTAVLPLNYSDRIELAVDTRLSMVAPLFGDVVTLNRPYSDWRRHPSAYSSRRRRHGRQWCETLKRTRVFNRFCRERQFREIQLWRNRRFYLQLLRAAAPTFVYSLYYRLFRSSRRASARATAGVSGGS